MERKAFRIVDLTGALEEGIWTYRPRFPDYSTEPVFTMEADQSSVHRIILSSHIGTHIDVPGHLFPGGAMIDAVPLDNFIGPAVLIRVSPCRDLEIIDAGRLSETAIDLGAGDIAIIETGWDRHWNTPQYVRSRPYLTPNAARWLIDRGVKFVGIDTPNMGDPRILDSPERRLSEELPDRILLEAGISSVAALTNLSSLQSNRFWLFALPMKLKDMDGAPARVIAVEGIEDF